VVVETTYITQVQCHTALETHGLVAQWEGDNLNVWASTQAIYGVRDDLAEALKIPASRVRVVTEYMGGGFGAKFGPRIEGIAAAKLAKEAGAPVCSSSNERRSRPPRATALFRAEDQGRSDEDGKLKALHSSCTARWDERRDWNVGLAKNGLSPART
jgi:CO/xanthine dehydrogenase Mo-binding subunit